MAFPGGGVPQFPNNETAGMSAQEQQMVKAMQMGMESCVGKSIMSGVMGGGLGAMFGLFMASMRYDTPMSQPLPTPTPPPAAAKPGAVSSSTVSSVSASTVSSTSSSTVSAAAHPTAPIPTPTATTTVNVPLADLPLRQQLRQGLRDMYRSSVSSGKNFAIVGAVFSGTECTIEGLRAKNDIWNGVAGGCITGGVLARKAGPQAVAVGCAGFAVFSAAIDAYMRLPEDERSRPIA